MSEELGYLGPYEYDFLVVGAGLFGAVFTHEAIKRGKSVLVIDKRDHIGGNCYTKNRMGIEVHEYGPHIFHTNDKEVWDWINQFGEFNNFINSPIAYRKGKIYNLPFNMNTFYQIYGTHKPAAAAQKILKDIPRGALNRTPRNLEEQAICFVGKKIYKTLIKDYTEKQWGKKCRDLPPELIKRIPLRFTFDNNYYNCKYQGVPINGYTSLIKKMLKGADILLNTSYEDLQLTHPDFRGKKIIYTGPIDEFFNYQLGELEWRVLESISHGYPVYESPFGNAIVNFADKEFKNITRMIEHKFFYEETKDLPQTILTFEWTEDWKKGKIPSYPIEDNKNLKLYNDYLNLAKKYKNIYFCGRLGSYKYLDMDQIIKKAKDLFIQIENEKF